MASLSPAMFCKIVCVIAPALSIQFGLTPPNKPPPEKEQFIPQNKGSVRTSEVVLRRILAPGGPSTYFKVSYSIGVFLLPRLIRSFRSYCFGLQPFSSRFTLCCNPRFFPQCARHRQRRRWPAPRSPCWAGSCVCIAFARLGRISRSRSRARRTIS